MVSVEKLKEKGHLEKLGTDGSKIILIKPTRCTNFSDLFLEKKLYMFRIVILSITRSFSL